VPCASKVSIDVSFCSYLSADCCCCACCSDGAYVEGGETSAVLIERLVVELDELLWSMGQSRFDWRSARGEDVGGVVRDACIGWNIRAMALKSAGKIVSFRACAWGVQCESGYRNRHSTLRVFPVSPCAPDWKLYTSTACETGRWWWGSGGQLTHLCDSSDLMCLMERGVGHGVGGAVRDGDRTM
jgi:hypothetical protein